jgi:YgiT-type zinc finger domain-containing protein
MSSPGRKAETRRSCPACDAGELVFVEDIITVIEGFTFVERGWRCTRCGEEFLSEEESQRTIEAAKRLGIWGEPLKLKRRLSRSGRGTVLRIPSDIEDALGLKGDEEVLVSKAGRKIIVEIQG